MPYREFLLEKEKQTRGTFPSRLTGPSKEKVTGERELPSLFQENLGDQRTVD